MALKDSPVIVWFRQDLRLADNPALSAAAKTGRPIIPLYILDDAGDGKWPRGAASRWWLHYSLASLDDSLSGKLVMRQGDAAVIVPALAKKTGAHTVYWNKLYESGPAIRDGAIEQALLDSGLTVEIFNGSLLFEPDAVLKKDGTPYRVFTPYYRACLAKGVADRAQQAPKELNLAATSSKSDSLGLLPKIRWDKKFEPHWTPGEKGAWQRAKHFKENATEYATLHNRPDAAGTSSLSAHLHFGEIAPWRLWHLIGDRSPGFQRQLIWRNFAYQLLHDHPDMPERALRPGRRAIKWRRDAAGLKAWQQGLTGFPIVDAGMRQMWATGWMHNRVRLIVGSFLVKDLLIDWQEGARWFWDCLIDADLANNSQNWQWVAGCGVDASPFFRIFNPTTQGKKFDPKGDYVRAWVPELKNFPARFIHDPAAAPDAVWEKAGLRRDVDYPAPIVDHAEARLRALTALRDGENGKCLLSRPL